ncbi:hypothetical protein GCM10010519_01140 [Streptomyces lactacystinicus]
MMTEERHERGVSVARAGGLGVGAIVVGVTRSALTSPSEVKRPSYEPPPYRADCPAFDTGQGAESQRNERDHGNLSVCVEAEELRIALPLLGVLR